MLDSIISTNIIGLSDDESGILIETNVVSSDEQADVVQIGCIFDTFAFDGRIVSNPSKPTICPDINKYEIYADSVNVMGWLRWWMNLLRSNGMKKKLAIASCFSVDTVKPTLLYQMEQSKIEIPELRDARVIDLGTSPDANFCYTVQYYRRYISNHPSAIERVSIVDHAIKWRDKSNRK